jgi:hypothetical protein
MKLNFAFLTLFTNYNQIRLIGGRNNYRIVHIGKQRLNCAGLLPDKLMWWKWLIDLGVDDGDIVRIKDVDE